MSQASARLGEEREDGVKEMKWKIRRKEKRRVTDGEEQYNR